MFWSSVINHFCLSSSIGAGYNSKTAVTGCRPVSIVINIRHHRQRPSVAGCMHTQTLSSACGDSAPLFVRIVAQPPSTLQ